MTGLRRSRTLALLLLLLTPGLGGWAVQVLHPCASAGSRAAMAPPGGHHHEQGGLPSQADHQAHCRCIGSCQTAVPVRPATAPTVAAPIPAYQLLFPRPADANRFSAGRVPELHPPATAPPALS
jgi:hypothetical protein